MFTINHTYFKRGNVQLVVFDKTSFYFQVSEVKGLKRENRVEENICKTFKKKKMKARWERDHRLKLQQCAAVMEVITRSGANRKLALWTSDHPVFTPPWAQSGGAEVLDFFQRGLPEVRQRSHTWRSWELHNAIRTSHLIVCMLHFCVVFFCFFHFSWFFCVLVPETEVFYAQWVAPLNKKKKKLQREENICCFKMQSGHQ